MKNLVTNEISGTSGYRKNARVLSAQYESIRFNDVHSGVQHLYPNQACIVLDIGAGSGRDAAALAERGHRVVAVEPVAEFRREGKQRHPHSAIEWVNDSLPELKLMRQRNQRFDLILLTAVWMHLDQAKRKVAMASIVELLVEGGLLSMTLRHGPIPNDRVMFEVSADETIELASQFGLYCKHKSAHDDVQGRADVFWSSVVLQKH